MKWKGTTLLLIVVLLALLPFTALADKPTKFDSQGVEVEWAMDATDSCTRIQDGVLTDSMGEPLTLGYDIYGYNYQAHIFNGRYCDYDRVIGGASCEVGLVMKWNDAWLANTDCDGDYKLDRHYGFPGYIGSGAWLTNHMWGTYTDADEDVCEWDYFTKIVAVPADATPIDGVWYALDGTEIGPVIWGAFATIQTVENDPCAGLEGIQYLSPDHSGLGGW